MKKDAEIKRLRHLVDVAQYEMDEAWKDNRFQAYFDAKTQWFTLRIALTNAIDRAKGKHMAHLIQRSNREVREHDVVVGPYRVVAEHEERFVASWRRWSGNCFGQLFVCGDQVWARGNAKQKAYAAGFFDGWRS